MQLTSSQRSESEQEQDDNNDDDNDDNKIIEQEESTDIELKKEKKDEEEKSNKSINKRQLSSEFLTKVKYDSFYHLVYLTNFLKLIGCYIFTMEFNVRFIT